MGERIAELVSRDAWIILDFSIVAMYLLFNLYVGVKAGRGVTTLKEFAISDRKFAMSFVVATVFATIVGAPALLGNSSKVFQLGFIFTLATLGWPLLLVLISKILAIRSRRFLGLLSVGDIINSLYGKRPQVITGVSAVLLSTGYVAAQVSAIGYLFSYFLSIPLVLGVIIGCGIVITYSAFGGIKSVVATDFIQFSFIMLLIPILLICCLVAVKGMYGEQTFAKAVGIILNNAPEGHVNVFFSGNDHLMCLSIFVMSMIPDLDPSFTQRMLITDSSLQTKKAISITAGLILLSYLLIGFISISIHTLIPDASVDTALIEVLHKVMPLGFKGVAIAGLLAAVMSSSDSDLNVASIALVNDVVKPFMKTKFNDYQYLMFARIATVLIGVGAVVIALKIKGIFDILVYAFNFWAPIVTPPLLAGFFGKEGSERTFLVSAFVGGVTVVFWETFLVDVTHVVSMVPATFMNGFAFLLSRRFLDGLKWEDYLDPNYVPYVREGKLNVKRVDAVGLKAWFKYIHQSSVLMFLRRVCDGALDSYGRQYNVFGTFGILAFSLQLFICSDMLDAGPTIYYMSVFAGLLCLILLLRGYWSPKQLRFTSVYWFFTIMYCLVILPVSWMLANNGGFFWLLNVALTMLVMAILVNWRVFITLQLLGMAIASAACIIVFRENVFASLEHPYYTLYVYLTAFFVVYFFYGNREKLFHFKNVAVQTIGTYLEGELVDKTVISFNAADYISENLSALKNLNLGADADKLLDEIAYHNQNIRECAIKSSNVLFMLCNNIEGFLPGTHMGFQYESVLDHIKYALQMKVLAEDIREHKVDICLDESKDFKLPRDNNIVAMIVINLVRNAITQLKNYRLGEQRIVKIWIENNPDGSNELHVEDNAGGVNPDMQERVFDEFFTGTYDGIGLGLTYCEHVLRWTDGHIELVNNYGKGAHFIVTFPKFVNVFTEKDLGLMAVRDDYQERFKREQAEKEALEKSQKK